MSATNPENNPSYLGGFERQLLICFDVSLRGLRNYSFDYLREPSFTLQEADLPFAKGFAETCNNLIEAQKRANALASDYAKQNMELWRKDTFISLMRIYAYSGAPLDALLIAMTMDYVGVDKKALREAIRPTSQFMYDYRVHTRDKKSIRRRGHEVMGQLDLVPFYGGRLMKIFDWN